MTKIEFFELVEFLPAIRKRPEFNMNPTREEGARLACMLDEIGVNCICVEYVDGLERAWVIATFDNMSEFATKFANLYGTAWDVLVVTTNGYAATLLLQAKPSKHQPTFNPEPELEMT